MYKLDLEKTEEPEIKLSTFVGSCRKQGNSRKKKQQQQQQQKQQQHQKHLYLLQWLHLSLWLCESQQTVENS